MASKKFEKGSEEWMMFADFYRMCQKHWVAETTDEYWNALISDAENFSVKYAKVQGGVALAKCLCDIEEKEDRKLRSNDSK